jgi:hypothetical protein
LNSGIGRYASVFQNLGPQITSLLGSYNVPVRDYDVSHLALHLDTLGSVGLQPGGFDIMRRAGVPWTENLWFSQAPLKTLDHVRLLEELDTPPTEQCRASSRVSDTPEFGTKRLA